MKNLALLDSEKKRMIIFFILSFFILLVPIPHIIRTFYLCMSPTDFSIYQQAFYELAEGKLNPYITIRETPIFSDHSDYIIWLAALFVKIFGRNPYGIIIFEWLWLVAAFFWIYYVSKESLFSRRNIIAFSMLVFSRGLYMGFEYAVHPTSWAVFPMLVFTYYVVKDNSKGIFWSSLFLSLFKEVFSIMTIILAIYYFVFRKKRKLALSLFSFHISLTSFILFIRPKLIPTIDYSQGLIRKILSGNFSIILERLSNFTLEIKAVAIYFVIIGYLYKTCKKNQRYQYYPVMIFSFFYILIHNLADKFYKQHYTPFSAILIGTIIFSEGFPRLIKNNKLLPICIALLMATSSSKIKKNIKFSVTQKERACNVNDYMRKRKEAFKKFKNTLPKTSGQEIVFATPALVPLLLRPNLNIRIQRPMYEYPNYDYLYFEKRPYTFFGEVNPEKYIKEVVNRCESHVTQKIYEDEFFIALKGDFPESCVKQGSIFPKIYKEIELRLLPYYNGKLYQVHRF